jgi:hypothetical protein
MNLGELVTFPAPHRGAIAPDTFEERQQVLARFNRDRIAPGVGEDPGYCAILHRQQLEVLERDYVRESRARLQALLTDVPEDADTFMGWFEQLKDHGPGQGDALFPWLAEEADLGQMRWFLEQEVAGEAGFDDLVALTQVKMPDRAKLEMARNYWDEMGRGDPKGMHGPMLGQLASALDLGPTIESTVPEALALANMMMALAFNRQFAFHSVGALGVIEMTAPGRSAYVSRGLDRLGIPKKQSHYFALHAVLDVKHSEAWNREVLRPLVAEDSRRARPIAEGALLRLCCGAQCFERYRKVLMQPAQTTSVRGH